MIRRVLTFYAGLLAHRLPLRNPPPAVSEVLVMMHAIDFIVSATGDQLEERPPLLERAGAFESL